MVDKVAAVDLVLQQFRSVLEKAHLTEEDDFFESGGDSYSAVLIITELMERTGVEIPIAQFFISPTASQLGTVLFELLQSDNDEAGSHVG